MLLKYYMSMRSGYLIDHMDIDIDRSSHEYREQIFYQQISPSTICLYMRYHGYAGWARP